eukprot:tig00020562_g11145.t1
MSSADACALGQIRHYAKDADPEKDTPLGSVFVPSSPLVMSLATFDSSEDLSRGYSGFATTGKRKLDPNACRAQDGLVMVFNETAGSAQCRRVAP